MNVLSDILCNTSSLILSSSYSGPLLSHDASVNKTFPKQQLLPPDKNFHLLDSFGPMPDPVSGSNAVGNGMFHDTVSPGNVGMDIIPPNFTVHSENEQTSAFDSGAYSDGVPSWLTSDLFKASESISPEFLPIDDIYPQGRNNILDINFPHDMNGHGKAYGNMNSNCLPSHQPLASDNRGFSTSESLLMSSLNVPQMTSVDKTGVQNLRYSHNSIVNQSSNDTTQSIINAILPLGDPCDLSSPNQLLSLPDDMSDAHLGSSVNQINISSGGQAHSIDMMSDKLPQISLNQLDLTLDDMQMIQNNFTGVQITEKHPCQTYPDGSAIGSCNPHLGIMPCNDGDLPNLNSFTQPQDVVDIARTLPHSVVNASEPVIITEDPLNSGILETKCFKCKYCGFLNLEKNNVRSHIQEVHLNPVPGNSSTSQNISVLPSAPPVRPSVTLDDNLVVTSLSSAAEVVTSTNQTDMSFGHILPSLPVSNDRQFLCSKCDACFSHYKPFEDHLASAHSIEPSIPQSDPVQETANNSLDPQRPSPETVLNKADNIQNGCHPERLDAHHVVSPFNEPEPDRSTPDSHDKDANQKPNNEEKQHSPQRKVSSHKNAWRKKLKRELGSYICEFKGCNVRFRALDNLEYHRKCHIAGSGKFACPECGKSFDHWGTAAGHLWRDHSTDLELHSCEQCSFKTYSLSNLEVNHKPIHQNHCSFTCDTCGKGFKNRKQLRNHQKIHSKQPVKGVRNFSCFICSREFLKMQFLRQHLDQVHNKQKSFICNQCGYSAGKSSTLAMHMRRHMGEKPFACDQCKYRTADHNSLRRHKMKHSGEKPYQCRFCSYACIQASSYKAHVEKQHADQMENVMFSCHICSFKTVRRDNFNAHIADHEMEKVSSQQIHNNGVVPQPETRNSHQESEVYPLVEAVDISLSHGDRSILAGIGKDMQSYLSESRLLDALNA